MGIFCQRWVLHLCHAGMGEDLKLNLIYYLNVDSVWQDASVAPFDNYYVVPLVEEDEINQVSITTPPIPINGTLAITYMLTQDIVNCATNVKIGSFGLTFNSPLSSSMYSSQIIP